MTREELFETIRTNPGIFQRDLGHNDGRNSRFLRLLERDGKIKRELTNRGKGNGSGAPGYRLFPILIMLLIIIFSGCLSSTKETEKPAPTNTTIGYAVPVVTPTPSPTTIPESNFTVSIYSMSGSASNLTILIELPRNKNEGNITLLCNSSHFSSNGTNAASRNYSLYLLEDVTCKELTKASVIFGKYNVSIGIPKIGSNFSKNVTIK